MLKYIHLALLLLLLGGETEAITINFDLSAQNKYGSGSILNTTCNKDTQIDFYFSSSDILGAEATHSTLKFMDINGFDLNLNLKAAGVSIPTEVKVTGWTIN
jgi:hypothetical protein